MLLPPSCGNITANLILAIAMVPLSQQGLTRQPRAAGNRLRLAACIASILAALIALQPTRSVAQDPEPRLFAAHVLDLRAAGVAGEQQAADFLASLPGSGIVDTEALPLLWSPFFANAIVKLGRLQSLGPAALYYNPLLDVALLTLWRTEGERYVIASARALPGDRLATPQATAKLQPPWLAVEKEPLDAMAQITFKRLEAFSWAHPAEAQEAARASTTFAADAADMRAVLPRLAWNAAHRLEWSDGTHPWLPETLAAIEAALAANDPAALAAAAPETDAETAAVLADLPPAFAAGLTLDMTLETGEADRLLIGSLPDEGDVYVLVLCRLEGDACGLRRFILISLLG